jgi:hypothetical protein
LRRLPEHLLPSRRFAHDPRLCAADSAREHPPGRVELTGPGTAVRVVARRGRQLLVRYADGDVVDGDVVDDAPGKGQMLSPVRVWVLRPEPDGEHLSADASSHGGREH